MSCLVVHIIELLYLFVTIISLIIISLLSQSTTHYLKFYDNNLGFIMTENIDGSGAQNYFGKNDYKGDIWDEIDAQPISVNILSFIPKVLFNIMLSTPVVGTTDFFSSPA